MSTNWQNVLRCFFKTSLTYEIIIVGDVMPLEKYPEIIKGISTADVQVNFFIIFCIVWWLHTFHVCMVDCIVWLEASQQPDTSWFLVFITNSVIFSLGCSKETCRIKVGYGSSGQPFICPLPRLIIRQKKGKKTSFWPNWWNVTVNILLR